MFSLYVSSLPSEITLEDLIIYFQSAKSGGGDVDFDACKLDGDKGKALVVFEKRECKYCIYLTLKPLFLA